jgi:hypothetical protein
MVILLSNRLLSPSFHKSNRWSIKSSTQKKDNPHSDTSEWEKEIDQLVYKLYELTD